MGKLPNDFETVQYAIVQYNPELCLKQSPDGSNIWECPVCGQEYSDSVVNFKGQSDCEVCNVFKMIPVNELSYDQKISWLRFVLAKEFKYENREYMVKCLGGVMINTEAEELQKYNKPKNLLDEDDDDDEPFGGYRKPTVPDDELPF